MKPKDYIEFVLIERKPKTLVYSVRNIHHGNELGRIYWYPRWRQYAFDPGLRTIWSWDCLRKVSDFIAEEMERMKIGRRE